MRGAARTPGEGDRPREDPPPEKAAPTVLSEAQKEDMVEWILHSPVMPHCLLVRICSASDRGVLVGRPGVDVAAPHLLHVVQVRPLSPGTRDELVVAVLLVNQAILLVWVADQHDIAQADAGEDGGPDRAGVVLQCGKQRAGAVANIPHALSTTSLARDSRWLKILSSWSMCHLEKGFIRQVLRANASSPMI